MPAPISTSLTLRRLLFAVIVTAATLIGSTLGNPAIANAFDQSIWDSCRNQAAYRYLAGDITTAEFSELKADCCLLADGNYQGGTCSAPLPVATSTRVAPPSVAANPDVPAGPPPPSTTKPAPKPSLTFAPDG